MQILPAIQDWAQSATPGSPAGRWLNLLGLLKQHLHLPSGLGDLSSWGQPGVSDTAIRAERPGSANTGNPASPPFLTGSSEGIRATRPAGTGGTSQPATLTSDRRLGPIDFLPTKDTTNLSSWLQRAIGGGR